MPLNDYWKYEIQDRVAEITVQHKEIEWLLAFQAELSCVFKMSAAEYLREFDQVIQMDGRTRSVMTLQELRLSGNHNVKLVDMSPDTEKRILSLILKHLSSHQHPILRLI